MGEEEEVEDKKRYERILEKLLKIKEEEKEIKQIISLIKYGDNKIDLFMDGKSISEMAALAAAGARVIKNLYKKTISEKIDQDLGV